MRTHTVVESPIGPLTLVAREGTLSGVYMEGHRHSPPRASFGARVDHGFESVDEQLAEYFTGDRRTFTVDTVVAGEWFTYRVWRALGEIPYGQTRTYGELAEQVVGRKDAARAVGTAVGRNPLSVVVPCHRVVGANGSLTGFAGGLDRKRFLLDLESPVRAPAPSLF